MAAGSLKAVSVSYTFLPGAVAAIAGWAVLGEPLRVPPGWPHPGAWQGAVLGVFLVLGLTVWPLLAMTALFLPSAAGGILVPRSWRRRYRRRLIDHGFPRDRQRSSYVSKRLERVVHAADRHRCIACGQRFGVMHVDHYRPWILGGLTILPNLTLLCEHCNLAKSCYWKESDGYEIYSRHANRANIPEARHITRRIRYRRFRPGRWVRAAWALAA